jgi:hypothetical protein
VFVPELAVLNETRLDQLRRYVQRGGRLIAFAHASLLDDKSQQRNDYGLRDVYGAHFAGQVTFEPPAHQATIAVDSEYNEAYGAHVLAGGRGEAWASAGTPMPHWIEITLPKMIELAQVELVNRPGPYQITDFVIETDQSGKWKQIKDIRNATGREIRVAFTPPAKVVKLRIKILRELYQNEDRQYADLAAIRVLDTQGRDWVGGAAARIPLTFREQSAQRMFGALPIAWPPMAVRTETTSARVIANLQGTSSAAAILSNHFGAGEAYLITTGDGALDVHHPSWAGLARLAAGDPTVVVSGEDARRYRIILTRVAGAHVLHVIDSQADTPNLVPRRVSVSLLSARLGDPQQATRVSGREPSRLRREGARISLVVRPDPVATVILK